MAEIDVAAVKENLQQVIAFVDRELEQSGCERDTMLEIYMAVEEIFVNVCSYAYDPEVGQTTIRTEIVKEPLSVILSFIDGGVPYDPLKRTDPKLNIPIKERSIGGLGIFLVKQTMDDVAYEYRDGKNILTIKKKL